MELIDEIRQIIAAKSKEAWERATCAPTPDQVAEIVKSGVVKTPEEQYVVSALAVFAGMQALGEAILAVLDATISLQSKT